VGEVWEPLFFLLLLKRGTDMNGSKPWYQSKTMIANIIIAIVSVLTALAGTDLVIEIATEHPWIITGITLLISVLNMALRFITKQPIFLGKKPPVALLMVGVMLCSSVAVAAPPVRLSGKTTYTILCYNKSCQPTVILVRVEGEKITFVEMPIDYITGSSAPIPVDPVDPVDPIDPGDPDPGDLTVLGKTVRDSSLRVTGDPNRGATSSEIAAIYDEYVKKIKDGSLTGQTAYELIEVTVEAFLTRKGMATHWQGSLAVVRSELTKLAVTSQLNYEQHLGEVSAGYKAAGDPNTVLDIATIVKVIKIVIEAKQRGELLNLQTVLQILFTVLDTERGL
jgi:hypothetical protein